MHGLKSAAAVVVHTPARQERVQSTCSSTSSPHGIPSFAVVLTGTHWGELSLVSSMMQMPSHELAGPSPSGSHAAPTVGRRQPFTNAWLFDPDAGPSLPLP